MALSINRLTNIITVPQADLTLIAGTLYEHNTNTYRLNLKAIEANEEGIVFDDVTQHNTEVTVAGTTFARTIEMINAYSTQYQNLSYSVRLVGSNNNFFDIQNGKLVQNLVQVIPTNSAGLITSAETANASFGEVISIDAVNGTPGTLFPAGNLANPVTTLADAKLIASNRGIKTLSIRGPFIFGAADSISSFVVRGAGTVTTDMFTCTAGVLTVNTRFERCSVQGTLNGKIEADGVIFALIFDMDYSSWLFDCWFDDDVALTGGGQFSAINCGATKAPGMVARPVFDYANVNIAKSNFLRWSGNIGFINITAGNVALQMDGGEVFLEASNTGGSMVVSGIKKPNDLSGAGFTVTFQSETVGLLPDAVNSSTMATDAVGALEFATDAVQEIVDGIRQQVLTEGYAVDGSEPTLEQILYMIWADLGDFAFSGTAKTSKKLDGVTTAMVHRIDNAVTPTSKTRES